MVMLVVFDGVRLGLVRAQHELEAQLSRSRRLEAIGRVAGGVAHDFNNLLTVILANASLLAEEPPLSSDASVLEIRAAAKRGAQLTRQLLAFARQQRLEPRAFDLAALVTEERTMLARLIPENVTIEVDCPDRPVWVHADPGQIPAGPAATSSSTRATPCPPGASCGSSSRAGDVGLRQPHGLRHGPRAWTRRRSSAPSSRSSRPRAPWARASASRPSTGSSPRAAGRCACTRAPGGTEFVVLLPAAVAPRSARIGPGASTSCRAPVDGRSSSSRTTPPSGSATTRLLQSPGHDVVAHADITGALADLAAGRPTAFDLILSDVVMPGGGGPELLRVLPPDSGARVLLMSGYAYDALRDPDLARVPFIPEALHRA